MKTALPIPELTDAETRRFWSYVSVPDENGCMVWLGARVWDGYGRFKVQGKTRRAHRVAYALAYGDIPEGAVLDHVACDNPPCVNPEHLEPTDAGSNCRRSDQTQAGINSRKAHCSRGHELSGDNVEPQYRPAGGRACRKCRATTRRLRAERKGTFA